VLLSSYFDFCCGRKGGKIAELSVAVGGCVTKIFAAGCIMNGRDKKQEPVMMQSSH
jgi:hypothetical protein